MSVKEAKDFLKKSKHNKEIQKAAHERSKSVVDIGRDHGHEFTKEEFNKAAKEDGAWDREDPDCCIGL